MEKLTSAEIERLVILIEECAEVQQIASKILRHGYESHNPFDEKKIKNRDLLETELGDLQFAVEFLSANSDVNAFKINGNAMIKSRKIGAYLHHNTL